MTADTIAIAPVLERISDYAAHYAGLCREVGEAYVLRRPGSALDAEAIAAHCRKYLANYKVPKRVFARDELPMLPVGKIDKARLKREVTT